MRTTSPFWLGLKTICRDRRVTVSSMILFSMILAVIVGPWFTPPFEKQILEQQLQSPTFSHWLGTDHLGRDLLARILTGGRLSLSIGIIATAISIFVGTIYGCISGFYGKKTDMLLMRIVDILYALPYMFLVIILIFQFGKNIYVLFAALGLVQWLTIARIVRGQVLALKNEEFISAAKALGASNLRIIFRHIIPNVLGIVLIYATLTVPSVILQESFLSFLGLNVQNCTWGVLIADGKDYMDSGWWLILFPSLTLTLCLLCMNFLGDGLRDALDPSLSKSK